MALLLSFFLGVLGSIVASVVFLFALYLLRPKIQFSSSVADQSKNGEHMFAFKVLNRSRWALTHVEFELTLITPKAVSGGVVLTNKLLPLVKQNVFEIGRFDKKDKDAHFAVRIGSPVDLYAICETEGQFLYLTVSAQHSFSGFQKVFTKLYHVSDIKKGRHEHGLGLDVK